MAVKSKAGISTTRLLFTPGKPKRTRQGSGLHTNLGATSRNGRRKRYRGQGR
jgi:hypothetical protein